MVAALSDTVLLLPFDEDVGAVWYADGTTYQHNARCDTLDHCPTAGVPGHSNNALQFSGGARAAVPHTALFDFDQQQSFSIQAWIKTSGAAQPIARILTKHDAGQGYSLQLQNSAVAALELNGAVVTTGGPDLRDNRWHQLVGIIDRVTGQARLYVDGALRGQAPFTGSVANTASIDIGGWHGAAAESFSDAIDDVSIARQALSPDEVRAFYLAGDLAWRPVALAQSGPAATATTWTTPVPGALEGLYQLDLRGTDTLGNRRVTGNRWRGVIDAMPPRVSITAQPTGASYVDPTTGKVLYAISYSYAAEDLNLSDLGWSGPCDNRTQPERGYRYSSILSKILPDWTFRTRLSTSCTVWVTANPPPVTVRACDIYGNCASNSAQAQTGDGTPADPAITPLAVVVSPADKSIVASDGTVPVIVAAEARQFLRKVVISLNGSPAATISFAEADAITRTVRTVTLTPPGEGSYTVTAQASDWSGTVQSRTIPIDFILDTNPPNVTLTTAVLKAGDTVGLGNAIARFSGTATDTIGLATVQLRVDDGPFQDVTLNADGTWTTAQWLGSDPQGQTFTITIRAIDLAGRMTEISRQVLVDIPAQAAVNTRIISATANLNTTDSARFAFIGSDANGTVLDRFECSLDGAAFTACSSPQSYSGLSEDVHTFLVRALDGAGAVDLSPATYTWVTNTHIAFVPERLVYLPMINSQP